MLVQLLFKLIPLILRKYLNPYLLSLLSFIILTSFKEHWGRMLRQCYTLHGNPLKCGSLYRSSLRLLVVDGNDLTSFPPGILKLNLKRIKFDNNFTHPYLWKENSLNSPQSLTQIALLFFLKNNLHKYYDAIPAKIQVLLKW